MVFYNSVWGFDLRTGWTGQTARNRNKHPSSHKMSYWVNNLRLGTYCIAWSNTIFIIAIRFQIISSSMYNPHPNTHSLVEWECHMERWMSWSPASDEDAAKIRMMVQIREGELDLGVNGKCSDQVDTSCWRIRFVTFLCSSPACQLFLSFLYKHGQMLRLLRMGHPQTRTV